MLQNKLLLKAKRRHPKNENGFVDSKWKKQDEDIPWFRLARVVNWFYSLVWYSLPSLHFDVDRLSLAVISVYSVTTLTYDSSV